MVEPDFTDMPFGLAQAIDVTAYDLGGKTRVRVWPNFRVTGLCSPHTVASVPTLTEAYVIRGKVRTLVRIARRLSGNIPS